MTILIACRIYVRLDLPAIIGGPRQSSKAWVVTAERSAVYSRLFQFVYEVFLFPESAQPPYRSAIAQSV